MKAALRWLAVWILVFGGLASLVAAAGLVPIRASVPHLPVTRTVLTWVKHQAVTMHTLGDDGPALDDPAAVLRGAGHYETACVACHGAPGLQATEVSMAMTPRPPRLESSLLRWTPEQLFFLVKHGVKFTGMPAWPALVRDDEVWDMVAFLVRYADLTPEEYRRLALGANDEAPFGTTAPTRPPEPVEASCRRCHGADGGGRGGAFPRLAGQSASYLQASLEAYARGVRPSGVMQPVAAALDPEAVPAVAAYYASLQPLRPDRRPTTGPAGLDALARGGRIAAAGVPDRKVPACAACHGPGPEARHDVFPKLAGQAPEYLERQLALFRAGVRGGTAFAPVMEAAAKALTPGDAADVAAYYASLAGGR